MTESFEGKVAVVTGGARGIGAAIVRAFRDAGATVHIIDITPGDWFVGDVSDKATLERFAAQIIEESRRVDCLVNNALPLMKGLDACSYEDFQYALAVGVTFAFLQVRILPAVLLIGCITFLLSMLGVKAGSLFGKKYQKKAEIAGGVILILLGIKILLEHLGVISF